MPNPVAIDCRLLNIVAQGEEENKSVVLKRRSNGNCINRKFCANTCTQRYVQVIKTVQYTSLSVALAFSLYLFPPLSSFTLFLLVFFSFLFFLFFLYYFVVVLFLFFPFIVLPVFAFVVASAAAIVVASTALGYERKRLHFAIHNVCTIG